jgi:predicted anti-sigma-YlaC factor YlaD
MELSSTDIQELLQFVSRDGEMDCEECFKHLAEFAEHNLEGKSIPLAMLAIQEHLEECPCCKGFFDAFVEALKECENNECEEVKHNH